MSENTRLIQVDDKSESQSHGSSKLKWLIPVVVAFVVGIGVGVFVGYSVWDTSPSCPANGQYPYSLNVSTPSDEKLLNFSGPVVWPSSKAYADLRLPWQGFFNYSSYPTVIVQPKTAEDVRLALEFAADKGLQVIPRNGGHSYSALSITRGMVIDVNLMNEIEVGESLPDGDTLVTIGAGQTNFGMYAKLAPYNLSAVGGGCPSVGITGLTLGGGGGSVSRTFGIASDRVESIEVVAFNTSTNKYEILNASASSTHTKDLFFALRGGMGGNYGVVTRWQTRAFHIHTVHSFSFTSMARLNETAAVIATFINWANTDFENSTTVNIAFSSARCDEPTDTNAAFNEEECISTQQQITVTLSGTCICEDGPPNQETEGNCSKCDQRVDNLSTILNNSHFSWVSHAEKTGGNVPWYKRIWEMTGCETIYNEITKDLRPSDFPPNITDKNIKDCIEYWQIGISQAKNNRQKSLFLLSDPDSTFFERVLDFMFANAKQIVSPGLGTNVELYHWAGEMTKVPKPGMESAWSHRDVTWLVQITSSFTARTNGNVISAQQQLLNSVYNSLSQDYRDEGKLQDYQNFPDTSLVYRQWATAYFPPETLKSLIAINTKYNPHNIYRTVMSIPVSYP